MKNDTKHYYNIMLCGAFGLCVGYVLMAHNGSRLAQLRNEIGLIVCYQLAGYDEI